MEAVFVLWYELLLDAGVPNEDLFWGFHAPYYEEIIGVCFGLETSITL
ncbi:MAG: hypothetical protein V4585_16755 [Bacteroidota bacterium]